MNFPCLSGCLPSHVRAPQMARIPADRCQYGKRRPAEKSRVPLSAWNSPWPGITGRQPDKHGIFFESITYAIGVTTNCVSLRGN